MKLRVKDRYEVVKKNDKLASSTLTRVQTLYTWRPYGLRFREAARQTRNMPRHVLGRDCPVQVNHK